MYKFNNHLIGRSVKYYPSLGSTNEEAKALLNSTKLPEGTLIITDDQYRGKGQMGNHWKTQPGLNLTFSLILYPKVLPTEQFLITQFISRAIQEVILKLLPEKKVKVKWPNDIYVGQKKIAGILIENILSGNKIQSSIIGIGLNVNQTNFPPPLKNPTSLQNEKQEPFQLAEVLQLICDAVEKDYELLNQGKIEAIRSNYLDGLFKYQERLRFQRSNGDIFSGEIIGVNQSGHLMIEVDGRRELFANKQIQFIE